MSAGTGYADSRYGKFPNKLLRMFFVLNGKSELNDIVQCWIFRKDNT